MSLNIHLGIKISALEGECIGIEFTIGLAYKSNTSASFKTMDGNVIQGGGQSAGMLEQMPLPDYGRWSE